MDLAKPGKIAIATSMPSARSWNIRDYASDETLAIGEQCIATALKNMNRNAAPPRRPRRPGPCGKRDCYVQRAWSASRRDLLPHRLLMPGRAGTGRRHLIRDVAPCTLDAREVRTTTEKTAMDKHIIYGVHVTNRMNKATNVQQPSSTDATSRRASACTTSARLFAQRRDSPRDVRRYLRRARRSRHRRHRSAAMIFDHD